MEIGTGTNQPIGYSFSAHPICPSHSRSRYGNGLSMVRDARVNHLQLEATHYGISMGQYTIEVERIGPTFNPKETHLKNVKTALEVLRHH